MSSPEIWKVLESFCQRFKSKTYLPYTVSWKEKHVRLVASSKLNMFVSSSFFLVHTLYCFLYLVAIAMKWNTQRVSNVQILVLLFCLFVPACLLAMQYTICFTPEVAPAILNALSHFEKTINGKLYFFRLPQLSNALILQDCFPRKKPRNIEISSFA